MKRIKTWLLTLLTAATVVFGASAKTDELGLTPKHWYEFNDNLNSSGDAELKINGENGPSYTDGVKDRAYYVASAQTQPYGSGVSYGDASWSIVTVAKTGLEGLGESEMESFWTTGWANYSGVSGEDAKWFGLYAKDQNTVIVAYGHGEGGEGSYRAVTEKSLAILVENVKVYHAYAIVYDGSGLKVYVDGVLAADESGYNPPRSGYFQFGSYSGVAMSGIKKTAVSACLDDWRLYQLPLTADQVKTITKTFVDIKIDVPTAKTGLIYNGETQTGVEEGEGYTLEGNTAKDAGDHQATATLASGYRWADGTTGDKKIDWSIAAKPVTVTADDKKMILGGKLPELTYKITAGELVGDEKLTGTLTVEGDLTVGAHDIVQANDWDNPNYAVTFVKGTLTIRPGMMIIFGSGKE